MFNPQPQIQLMRFGSGGFCCVIDEVLQAPEQLTRQAIERRAQFVPATSAGYPGISLAVDPGLALAMRDFFSFHLRRYFDARRVVELLGRYSLVTLPPEELSPLQSVCHQDPPLRDPSLSRMACVIYLFRDAALGGTSFYEATRSYEEISQLFADGNTLSKQQFAERHGIPPSYQCDSNAYFRRVATVEARWNRAVFYSGDLLHSGQITAPERLTEDPASGRLTLNFFFSCRRNLPG